MEFNLAAGCFYGELSKNCEVSGLRLTEIIYPPDHKTLEHSHELAYFSLTLKGTHTKHYGLQMVKCAPQTLVFHPPNQRQSGYLNEAGGRAFIIDMEPRILNRLCHHPFIAEKVAVFRGGLLMWFAARLYN